MSTTSHGTGANSKLDQISSARKPQCCYSFHPFVLEICAIATTRLLGFLPYVLFTNCPSGKSKSFLKWIRNTHSSLFPIPYIDETLPRWLGSRTPLRSFQLLSRRCLATVSSLSRHGSNGVHSAKAKAAGWLSPENKESGEFTERTVRLVEPERRCLTAFQRRAWF